VFQRNVSFTRKGVWRGQVTENYREDVVFGIYSYNHCDNYHFSFCTRTVTYGAKTETVGLYRPWYKKLE
jgi:hypothetical protein